MKTSILHNPFTGYIFVNFVSFLVFLLLPITALAFGGRVNYPNGLPAAGAQVNLLIDGKDISSIRCDSAGRFQHPGDPVESAIVQIKAPDGKDFASVNLPAKVFAKGETVIVLQPR
jgi:hypothetical protein